MSVTPDTAGDLLAGVSRLVRTARSYAHLREQQLGRAGLTHGVLLKLAHGPLRPGDLATLLHVSPSAVSRTAAALVEEGWVRRTSDPADGRACSLALTEAGTGRLEAMRAQQAEVLTSMLHDWDEDTVATLATLLGQLSEALEQAVDTSRHPGTPSAAALAAPSTTRPQEALA